MSKAAKKTGTSKSPADAGKVQGLQRQIIEAKLMSFADTTSAKKIRAMRKEIARELTASKNKNPSKAAKE